MALLWAAHHQLGLLPLADLRTRCAELLANPLVVPSFPQYLSGFVQALEPAPKLAPFVVEVMSNAFAKLPDPVLLPWLPSLITTLRDQAGELVPVLIREAGRTFPGNLPAVDAFVPPWTARTAAQNPSTQATPPTGPATDLLAAHPATTDALAALLGLDPTWQPTTAPPSDVTSPAIQALLAAHPDTTTALTALLVRTA
jgi:hypothetical protein